MVVSLNKGEIASANNPYVRGMGLLHEADGFYYLNDRTLRPRPTLRYVAAFNEYGTLCNEANCLLRGWKIAVYVNGNIYTFLIYDINDYDRRIARLTIDGVPESWNIMGQIRYRNVTIIEMDRRKGGFENDATLFKGNSVILVAGLGLTLKYLDDDLQLKDYRIYGVAQVPRYSPPVLDICFTNSRLALLMTDIINDPTGDTTIAKLNIHYSAEKQYYNFIDSQSGGSSSFYLQPVDLAADEVVYSITDCIRQTIVLTNKGTWVVRTTSDELAPFVYSDLKFSNVDSVPCAPSKAVVLDKIVLCPGADGFLRMREYSTLSAQIAPSQDPGGTYMPVQHPRFDGIRKVVKISYPNAVAVLDDDDTLYLINPAIMLDPPYRMYPRTTLFKNVAMIGDDPTNISFTVKNGPASYVTYVADYSMGVGAVGARRGFFPKLTVTQQGPNWITVNVTGLIRFYLHVGAAWYLMTYDGSKYQYDRGIPDISGQELEFLPLKTHVNRSFLPDWVTEKYVWRIQIGNNAYLLEGDEVDMKESTSPVTGITDSLIVPDDSTTLSVIIESDTLPGEKGTISEVGLLFDRLEQKITFDPSPEEDVSADSDPVRTLYRRRYRTMDIFSTSSNTFTIKIKYSMINLTYKGALAKIYTL